MLSSIIFERCDSLETKRIYSSRNYRGVARSAETVEANRVVVEQPALICLTALAHDCFHGAYPVAVGAGERAQRPVAAKHHPIWAEQIEQRVDDGRKVSGAEPGPAGV